MIFLVKVWHGKLLPSCRLLKLLQLINPMLPFQFHFKQENTMEYLHAMVALVSSSVQYVVREIMFVKLKPRDIALLIKHTGINAVRVASRNAFVLA